MIPIQRIRRRDRHMTPAELTAAKRRVLTDDTITADCARCQGTGALAVDAFVGAGVRRAYVTCPACLDRAHAVLSAAN